MFFCRLKVIVMEVRGLKSLPPNKIVYCTMEVDGCDKLQTDQAEASKPWYAALLLLVRFKGQICFGGRRQSVRRLLYVPWLYREN